MSEHPNDDGEEGGVGRRPFLQLAALAGVSVGSVNEVTAGSPGQDPNRDRDGELVLGLPTDVDNLTAEATRLGPDGAEVVDVNETLGFAVLSLPDVASAAEEADVLAERDDVRYAEQNGKKRALFEPVSVDESTERDGATTDDVEPEAMTPNDTYFGHQYAPQQVDAPEAWEKTTGSSDVTIAVVDTGTKYDHEDLAANMDDSVANHGWDFVDNNGDPYPEDFSSGGDAEDHGTHVSGIAGAVTDNGAGIAGISDCSLLAVRVLGTDGWGYHSDIASGIQWAADNGADIINLSLGSDGESSTMGDALEYAYNAGVFIVASAGNDAEEKTEYGPASQPQCMAVSSVDDNEDLSSFSNYGDYVEITAPGSSVLSTYPADLNDGGASDEYAYMSGTSMSAPVVAGVAGLTLSRLNWLSNDELRDHLKNTSDDIGLTAKEQGSGQVNAAQAVSVPEHDHVGENWAGTGTNVLRLENTETSGTTRGLLAVSNSPDGQGIYGVNTTTSTTSPGEAAMGVSGVSHAPHGNGIFGTATHETGPNFGLRGESQSSQGTGLYGIARADSGETIGVRGASMSPDGQGLVGQNFASSGDAIGVYGMTQSPDGYAVYSSGDLHVQGDFTASGTKNFVQTVSTDAGTRDVAYTAVEADTPHTETSGVAHLENGRTTIDLPEHFGLVTSEAKDLTVQVTPYSTDASGPAVTHRSTDRIVIEDCDGTGDYEFAYTVRGTRAGYENEPVVSKPSEPISPDGPSMPDHSGR